MSRTPPRIAYLCSDPGIPPDGTKGASVHFREMARALAQAGAELDVLMAREGIWPDRPVHVIKPERRDDNGHAVSLIRANDAMVAAASSHGPHTAVYERLSSFGVAGARYARNAGIPLILEVNAPLWLEDARYRRLEMNDTAREMAMESIQSAERVIVVSAELARILIAAGVPEGRIVVMHNGVNREMFESALPHELPAALAGRTCLAFMGSLKPWHGIEFLLEAFELCAVEMNLGLWIVGDGTLRDVVRSAAERFRERIHWQGAVDHDAIPSILRAADIAVAPYGADAPSYFCPLKVIEALAAGCPLLASDAKCVTDVVGDHSGVRLFRRGDKNSFRTAVRDMVDTQPTLDRERTPSVPDEYTWANNARRVLEFVTLILLASLILQACQRPNVVLQRSLVDLTPGMWVEAEGNRTAKSSSAVNITQTSRTSSSGKDKLEVTAQVETVDEDRFGVLGRDVTIVTKTKFENLDQESVDRYPIRVGDWLRLKLRNKAEDRLRARSVRSLKPTDQFKIEGEITGLDRANNTIDVGSIRVQASQETRVRLLGDGPRRKIDDPLSVFLEDEQKSVPFTIRLTDTFLVGGQMSLDYERQDEFDLNRLRRRNRDTLNARGKLDILWILDARGSFVLVEGSYSRKDRFKVNQPDRTSESRSLSRAYAYFRYSDRFRIQVGRQDFDDYREWLYDEVLDGVRLQSTLGPFTLEASASAGREFGEEESLATEETAMYAALLRYNPNDAHRVTLYAVRLKDSSAAEFEPFLFGLRSYSRPSKGLGHWLELARATGSAGANTISGSAIDAGLMYRGQGRYRPTVYAGYAYATGKMPGSGEMGFRQTGLNDNNGKFGGVSSFRYYGELFEPELTNMDISTLGVGIRPTPGFSVDILAHSYRQDYKTTVSNSGNLRAAPNGVGSSLGWELDVIAAFRYRNRFRAELVISRFEPGSAYDNRDAAHKIALQARYKF
jgi:glycosyltransferase involved in cell wall biosynthesis